MARHFSLIVVVASVGLMATSGAFASDRNRNGLPESVSRVERETGGRVLSAERRHQGGREVNRIKVYTPEGRVRVMWDAPRGEAPKNAPPAATLREPPPEMRNPMVRDVRPIPGAGDRR